MKWLRRTALGLVVGLCALAVVPIALADDGTPQPPKPIVAGPGGWVGWWLKWVAGWFGWEELVERPAARADASGGTDTSGKGRPPVATADGDCTGGVDPNGTPCRP